MNKLRYVLLTLVIGLSMVSEVNAGGGFSRPCCGDEEDVAANSTAPEFFDYAYPLIHQYGPRGLRENRDAFCASITSFIIKKTEDPRLDFLRLHIGTRDGEIEYGRNMSMIHIDLVIYRLIVRDGHVNASDMKKLVFDGVSESHMASIAYCMPNHGIGALCAAQYIEFVHYNGNGGRVLDGVVGCFPNLNKISFKDTSMSAMDRFSMGCVRETLGNRASEVMLHIGDREVPFAHFEQIMMPVREQRRNALVSGLYTSDDSYA